MASPRPHPTPDSVRLPLVEVRRGLLRLHKALIDSERSVFERQHGPRTGAQLLQALLEDPFFAWLRPYSALIVEIDEALAGREPVSAQQAREYVVQAREMTEPDTGERYAQALARDTGVRSLHEEIRSRIAAALG